ncbi:hypothetical protein EYF80_063041 [Liparis tanakae]|uniref:Uncharacterized protein n=1 Tax=Liparis tanakae TaxID=230148 RepID=A0A4Z2EDJ3_9TELE|nr:hypothetical protein EYF80_063041 [Liparis tanakae]
MFLVILLFFGELGLLQVDLGRELYFQGVACGVGRARRLRNESRGWARRQPRRPALGRAASSLFRPPFILLFLRDSDLGFHHFAVGLILFFPRLLVFLLLYGVARKRQRLGVGFGRLRLRRSSFGQSSFGGRGPGLKPHGDRRVAVHRREVWREKKEESPLERCDGAGLRAGERGAAAAGLGAGHGDWRLLGHAPGDGVGVLGDGSACEKGLAVWWEEVVNEEEEEQGGVPDAEDS